MPICSISGVAVDTLCIFVLEEVFIWSARRERISALISVASDFFIPIFPLHLIHLLHRFCLHSFVSGFSGGIWRILFLTSTLKSESPVGDSQESCPYCSAEF